MNKEVINAINEVSVSMEHITNMLKIAEKMVDAVAYGDVADNTDEFNEHMNCLSSFLNTLVYISKQRNFELDNILTNIQLQAI